MLKTPQRLLLALTICGLAVAAAAQQDSLVKQAQQTQQAGLDLAQQVGELGSQAGQQVVKQLQQTQQQYLEPQQLLEFGLNSVSRPFNYFLPNTFKGVTSDLSNGYSMLTNDGYNSLTSQFSSMGDSLMKGMQAAQLNLLRRYAQISQQQEDITRRMHEIVYNPEQLCRLIREQGQSAFNTASQQASPMAEQATRRPSSSWFGK